MADCMIVADNKFAPITAEEFWDSLMTVDDFVELILDRAPAFQQGFCPTFINKISTHV